MAFMRDADGIRLDSIHVLDATVARGRFSRSLGPFPTLLQSVDADDLNAISAGAKLAKWGDRSGRGLDFTQTSSALRPTVEVDTVGRRQVYCSGSQFMAASGFGNSAWGQPASYAQPLTICALVKMSSGSAAFRPIVAGSTQGASLSLALALTTNAPVLFAASSGATGGPALNDDQWHVVVGVFDTNRGWIMVDGYIVAMSTTQSQGANPLIQLGIGAYTTNTPTSLGARYRRVDVYNGTLTFQQASAWTAEVMAKWGLGRPPPQVNLSWQDVTDSGGQGIRVFTPPNLGTSAPLAIFNHQQGRTTTIDQSHWETKVIQALVARGFVVTFSSNHGADGWSSDASEADVANARSYVNTNIAAVTGTMMVGASMGGALSVISAKDNVLPDLRGVYLIDPAVSLQWMYANGYSASINTAFGITSAAGIPAGKDPVTLTGAQLPQGIRWRATASITDTTVAKTSNIDVLAPIIQASSPLEYAYVPHVGGHAAQESALGYDIDAFSQRCGFSGLLANLMP